MISIPIWAIASFLIGLLGFITLAVTIGVKIGSFSSRFVSKSDFREYKKETECENKSIHTRIDEVLVEIKKLSVDLAHVGG